MTPAYSLSKKLIVIGSVLLAIGLISTGMTMWFSWKLEGGGAAVNDAGSLRMQTWRLVSAVQAARPPEEIAALHAQMDRTLLRLSKGDPSRGVSGRWDDDIRKQLDAVEANWSSLRGRVNGNTTIAQVELRRDAEEFVEHAEALVHAIEHYLSTLSATLSLFQFALMLLAIAGAVVMLFTGYHFVINPLEQLRKGLARVEAGQLDTRVDVERPDEFGQVGAAFNRMAANLQSLYHGLEDKVVAKTRHIEAQRARLETLYEVSALLADAKTAEELSDGFAKRVRTAMGAAAVVVRWSEEAHQRYLMLASSCFPDEIRAEENALLPGVCACGNSATSEGIRVIPIRTDGAPRMGHCARAGFQHVVSAPVSLQNRPIGEVNLFYREEVTLSPEDLHLLDSLTNHLASAMEGVRAEALAREAAVGEERALLANELHDSIAQSLAFLKIQAQMLRSALEKGNHQQVQTILDELDAGLKESVGDVRELLVHFRTRTNNAAIEVALQETLQKFQHQTGLHTRLQVEGDSLPLAPDVQVQVLHVVQEALSNVRKHAQASEVVVQLSKGTTWRVVVKDDGSGFDSDRPVLDTHVGTRIMQERATRVGGAVRVLSSRESGTVVELRVPSAARANSVGVAPE